MVITLLKGFFKSTGAKPQRIIIYRNVILEKRARLIAAKELTLVRNAFELLEAGYEPKVTFICVQKRHHAKFFPLKSELLDKSGNIVPGTLIDSDITLPGEYGIFRLS